MADQHKMAADQRFAEFMADRGQACCPTCGRVLDRGDVSWNNANTGEGTPFTYSQIVCQGCDTEIAHWSSWYPGADDWDDFVDHVLPDMVEEDT